MMSAEQVIQLFMGVSGAVYRDDIKAFIAKRWRSFRRARTEDLKILTKRHLGPPSQKHLQPDPVFRETMKALVALVALLLCSPLVKHHGWALWLFQAAYYGVTLRLFLVLTIFNIYRAKLLPRVLAQRSAENLGSR
jgi:hypothetical protein